MKNNEVIDVLGIIAPETAQQYQAIQHAIDFMKRSAPDGWKLVPVEPTGDILKAMCDCEEDAPWSVIYTAMISAAPNYEDVE